MTPTDIVYTSCWQELKSRLEFEPHRFYSFSVFVLEMNMFNLSERKRLMCNLVSTILSPDRKMRPSFKKINDDDIKENDEQYKQRLIEFDLARDQLATLAMVSHG